MNTLSENGAATAADLRARMVGRLREEGDFQSEAIGRALATVPREAFAPDAPLERVYTREAVVITKRNGRGTVLSSVSAPWIQAAMLEQARIEPGMRVLEIGSGGYNAALIAELVGEHGEVTTVDIDSFVTDRAREYLAAAGYEHVRVLQRDAEHGVPEHAPYDRIIVTVDSWDIPPAWMGQLAEDGLLVVPLRVRGLNRSIAFARDGDHLISTDYRLCGFVPMQGEGAHADQLTPLAGEDVVLRVDGQLDVDAPGLVAALATPVRVHGSGVTVGGVEAFDDLDLWVATHVEGFGLLVATSPVIESGTLAKSTRLGAKTIVEGSSFAYRAPRPIAESELFEVAIHAHGPDADHLAQRYIEAIREWDRQQRGGPGVRFTVVPASTPDAELPEGHVVDKRHVRVLISWPASSS
ncbi:hypothetical protein GCM10022247_35240 [Allokutzneria multivorans]|uniref:Protein-L-isoaspartate O-methyltransferase n=1 Tax=Allokutzneria multivorans TaxID=1142134 RepID=A0ABP7SDB0_9PSEU